MDYKVSKLCINNLTVRPTLGSLFSLLEDFFFFDLESFLSGGFSIPRYRENGEPEVNNIIITYKTNEYLLQISTVIRFKLA